MTTKKRGLAKGRGLDALFGSIQKEKQNLLQASAQKDGALEQIAVELLQRGEYQPRRRMNEDALNDLAESIKQHGIMQPIVIRQLKDSEHYEIIAGERRWRAAQIAGLTHVPALVRDIPDQVAIALALIENIQRQDLNPMEQALALQRFQEEFGLSHQEIADTVGKARATVSNLLRLLSLDDAVKELLSEQQLDMGHARALLAVDANKQKELAEVVVQKALSVRQTEQLVREFLEPKAVKDATKASSSDIESLTQRLSEHLGAQVAIDHNAKGKGKIVIKYHSLDELDGILNVCFSD